jgi:hypothetical protein
MQEWREWGSDIEGKGRPQSELQALTKLVKITEDVRRYAAENALEHRTR